MPWPALQEAGSRDSRGTNVFRLFGGRKAPTGERGGVTAACAISGQGGEYADSRKNDQKKRWPFSAPSSAHGRCIRPDFLPRSDPFPRASLFATILTPTISQDLESRRVVGFVSQKSIFYSSPTLSPPFSPLQISAAPLILCASSCR